MIFCTFWRHEFTNLVKFGGPKMVKTEVFAPFETTNLISRKIWVILKLWNFHSVQSHLQLASLSVPITLGGLGRLRMTSLASWDFSTMTSFNLTAVCILRTLEDSLQKKKLNFNFYFFFEKVEFFTYFWCLERLDCCQTNCLQEQSVI